MPPVWRRNRHWLTPVLFLLPGLILFGSVILAASIETVWISLHDWDGIGAKTWVGLANYVELADDPQFYVSLKNNVIWLLIFMLAPPIGLALALIVNQQIRG
ncbi:MAG: sugar ABC transporter permease, partial [Mesorhizobium sp.]